MTVDVEVWADCEEICFRPGEENRIERIAAKRYLEIVLKDRLEIGPLELRFLLHVFRLPSNTLSGIVADWFKKQLD